MEDSIVDLRYKMNDILKALERNEPVHIFYHGKKKGVLLPAKSTKEEPLVEEHPLFGSTTKTKKPVEDIMQGLRGGRYK